MPLPRFDRMSQLERHPGKPKTNGPSRRVMVSGGNVAGTAGPPACGPTPEAQRTLFRRLAKFRQHALQEDKQ